MNRAVAVAKMHLLSRWTFIGIPAVIIAGSFLLSLAIWSLIPDTVQTKYSGAGQAVMWYFFGLGIQALTYIFPFSQGMSVSRRSFFLGTVGLFAVFAAGISVLYVVLGKIELATNGWGLNGSMFSLAWIGQREWWIQLLFYFLLMMFLFIAGFWGATIYKRWQTTGLLVMAITFAVLILGGAALASWQGWWPSIGAWLVSLTPGGVSLIALGLVVVLGATSYATLRRATP